MAIQQLRLTLHATGGAFKGSSDPYAEVKLLVSGFDGQPEERLLGRTEAIKNTLSPKWTKSFLFDYSSGKDAIIEVAVVDKIKKGRDEFIGYAVFEIEDILRSQGSITGKQLQGRQQGGILYARICKVPPTSAGKLTLRWQRFRSKKDPFFEVRRTYDGDNDESWTPIYRSERVRSWSESPEWNPASIDVNALCDGDLNRKIQLAVVYDKKGEHAERFTANTTVNELIKSNKSKSFNLMKRSKAKISLGECNITDADTSAMTKTVKKLQLSLHATDLRNVAGAFKGISNTYAEVKLLVSGSEKETGKLLGRTEVVKNSSSPKWTTSFMLDYNFGKEACIKVSVIDKVRKGSGPIGSAVFKIEDILRSRGNINHKQLETNNKGRQGGIYARICEVPSISAGKLILRWQEFRGTLLDPFFEVRRTYGDDGETWTPIYRSENVRSNFCPQWSPTTIDVNALCDGDLNRKIQLAVLHYDKKGENRAILDIYTTVNELVDNAKRRHEYGLMKGKGAEAESISLGECKVVEAVTSLSMKPPAGSDGKSDRTDRAHLLKLAEKKVKEAEEKAKKESLNSPRSRSDANSELWALLNYSKMRIETGYTPRLEKVTTTSTQRDDDGSISMANSTSTEEDDESSTSRSDDEVDSSEEEEENDELPSFLKDDEDDVDPEEARKLYEEAKFKATSILSLSEEKLTDVQMLQASLKRLPGMVKRKQQQHQQTRRQKRNQ